MTDVILNNLPLWTAAVKHKSAAGRGSRSKLELTGIKKLRELILELAVRGQLVPQDPNDEPASELVKCIAAEKAELIKAGKLKKQKPLPEITDEEKPFALPQGWEWVRLGIVGDWGAGATPSRSKSEYYGGEIPWFKSGELIADFIDQAEEFVTEKALQECSLRDNQVGDVLIAMYGATIGKTSILNVRGTTNQAVCACTPFSGISNVYLLTLLKAYKRVFTEMGAGGAQPNISREKIIATPFALPPFSEQKRIVAKVEELMALCDQLEQQSENHTGAHQQLVETLLATLTNTQSADELSANWARLAEHFDLLFAGPMGSWAVDRLKDTILQLAVQGKLVPQNPLEEPASALLARIEAEKAELIKQGKLKKQKPLPPITDDEKPFDLPQGWEWVRLSDCTADIQYGYTASSDENLKSYRLLRITDIQDGNVNWDSVPGCEITDDIAKNYFLENGDILIARTGGTIGKSYLVSELSVQSVFASYLIRLKKLYCSFESYLKVFLGSDLYWAQLKNASMGTGQPNVSGSSLKELVVPYPPLEEQTRIVKKVDQLFALCDQLKAALDAACDTQLQLSSAVVEQSLACH